MNWKAKMENTRSKPKLTYALSYGFLGGPLHAQKFKRLMKKSGYELMDDMLKADIIVAHSAGSWLMPPECKPKMVFYIGVPLNQTKPFRGLVEANKIAFSKGNLKRTLTTKAKVSFYGIIQPRRNLKIIKMTKTAKLTMFPKVPAVFIINRFDPWPKSASLEQFVKKNPWTYIELSGTHDDIWENSKRYIEIINHYARQLA